MKKNKYKQLLDTENEHLKKLNNIVLTAVQDEQLLTQRIYEGEDKKISFGDRLADKVASFGGSWRFILSFAGFMLLWISANIFLLKRAYDPYPFILLNLLLSTIAALQAPFIMMSQNRRETKDRERAMNDYQVNLKTEIELRNLHEKMNLLMQEQMQTLFEVQKVQLEMIEETRNMVRHNASSIDKKKDQ
jgi:uncharacterized membrane protein